jgi:hypothetical protein
MRPKGSEKTPGSGRRAGSTNKTTRDLKEMILGALHRAGGEDWLLEQMNANPVAFMTLVGKILPLQVTGKDGGPLEHRHMDVPKEETRAEWLARQQLEASARPATSGNGVDSETH